MFDTLNFPPEHMDYIARARKLRSETWTAFFKAIGKAFTAGAAWVCTKTVDICRSRSAVPSP